ncbi:MAG: hypothetical protein RR557_06435 [Bacilli bacterium]
MIIIFTIVLIFPGTPGEENFPTLLVSLIAVPTVNYNLWINHKKAPKIYSLFDICAVIWAILVSCTIINYLT